VDTDRTIGRRFHLAALATPVDTARHCQQNRADQHAPADADGKDNAACCRAVSARVCRGHRSTRAGCESTNPRYQSAGRNRRAAGNTRCITLAGYVGCVYDAGSAD
jgi:hypothetical protein